MPSYILLLEWLLKLLAELTNKIIWDDCSIVQSFISNCFFCVCSTNFVHSTFGLTWQWTCSNRFFWQIIILVIQQPICDPAFNTSINKNLKLWHKCEIRFCNSRDLLRVKQPFFSNLFSISRSINPDKDDCLDNPSARHRIRACHLKISQFLAFPHFDSWSVNTVSGAELVF